MSVTTGVTTRLEVEIASSDVVKLLLWRHHSKSQNRRVHQIIRIAFSLVFGGLLVGIAIGMGSPWAGASGPAAAVFYYYRYPSAAERRQRRYFRRLVEASPRDYELGPHRFELDGQVLQRTCAGETVRVPIWSVEEAIPLGPVTILRVGPGSALVLPTREKRIDVNSFLAELLRRRDTAGTERAGSVA